MNWQVVLSSQAKQDAKKLKSSGLDEKARELLRQLEEDPFQSPPGFEKLTGNLAGATPGESIGSIGWYTRFFVIDVW